MLTIEVKHEKLKIKFKLFNFYLEKQVTVVLKVLVDVVLVLQVFNLDDVSLQPLLHDFLQNRVSVVVVFDAHPPETVVAESEKRSACDVVLQEEMRVLLFVLAAVSGEPSEDFLLRPIVDRFGAGGGLCLRNGSLLV